MAASSTPSRCPQCRRQQKKSTKNLVVCIDGTTTSKNTNVSKLFAKVDLESTGPEQYAHYAGGIGAQAKSKKAVLRDTVDMAFARNVEKNVKESYSWLAERYTMGDQIYLFGFSRGAYQVRMLAAMIYEVGLMTPLNKDKFKEAYECYKSSCSGGQKAKQAARVFKKRFCWQDMRVHFIGVWDTISSVGFLPQDISLSRFSSVEHACHFRHALALDELRVKFMPEYLHEVNSLADFRYTNTSPADGKATSSTSEPSGVSDGNPSADKKKVSNIKEVWFAGSHSDVGGVNNPGRDHRPGTVSLLWMRREAAACGLVLNPTDIVWLPHDLDYGITNSMTNAWRPLEYTTHQVSYSGLGKKASRFHRQQPRRIIPGQKIHASVLYAHAYKPKATLGEGFDIPIIPPGLEDAKLDGGIWETGLFDNSAAEELIYSLGVQQGVAPINLDKLLFMVRFTEGRESVRNIPDWQDKFMKLMNDDGCATVVRLVAIVAYHEASCDPEACPNSCVPISEDILADARSCLKDVMDHHKHRDGPRVVALLRLLTKHRILRECILTKDFLETLVDSFDEAIGAAGRHFVLAMDGLDCLLQCVDIRLTIIEKLKSNPPGYTISRLSRILEVKDPFNLIAALRMVSILLRIPSGRAACSEVDSRINQLASNKEQLIGPLAAEICLALYDSDHPNQLNFRNTHVRSNFVSALLYLAHHPDLEREILFNVFELGTTELKPRHRRLIGELKTAILKEKNVRECTAATITLLKLCDNMIIREHYREIKLLDIFVSQLRRKDSALLAALALVNCLKYPDLEYIKDDKRLPQHIITMIRENYFDDAVGQFQGFQVFGELMQHADLRKEIMSRGIIKILTDKLQIGNKEATWSALMCLDTLRSSEPQYPWLRELCDTGLGHLKDTAWKVQKAGANILSALAQTEYAVTAISARVPEIMEMLLPESYSLIRRPSFPQTQVNSTSSNKSDPLRKKDSNTLSTPKSPSWMMGPAYVMGILAQNAILRDRISKTIQYNYVRELHQNGALVEKKDTAVWRRPLKSPNRVQVITMLDEMIKAVDDESFEEGSVWAGDAALQSHIHYWHRLVMPINVPVRVSGSLTSVPSSQDSRSHEPHEGHHVTAKPKRKPEPDKGEGPSYVDETPQDPPRSVPSPQDSHSRLPRKKSLPDPTTLGSMCVPHGADGPSTGYVDETSQVLETHLSQNVPIPKTGLDALKEGDRPQDVGPAEVPAPQSLETTNAGQLHGDTGPVTCEGENPPELNSEAPLDGHALFGVQSTAETWLVGGERQPRL